MSRFELIGVRIYRSKELNNTTYFKVGELKEAINCANEKKKQGFSYDFICCDKYGNYICEL